MRNHLILLAFLFILVVFAGNVSSSPWVLDDSEEGILRLYPDHRPPRPEITVYYSDDPSEDMLLFILYVPRHFCEPDSKTVGTFGILPVIRNEYVYHTNTALCTNDGKWLLYGGKYMGYLTHLLTAKSASFYVKGEEELVDNLDGFFVQAAPILFAGLSDVGLEIKAEAR